MNNEILPHQIEEERLKLEENYQITKEMLKAEKSEPPKVYWWENLG